ncbi:hypothetical protein TVAG_390520 [Trichomonas vaginalis G3]|uniref:Uncharacterized protein n=1 Tax=Trichomonas vaginalis (strain ATCC PRA-98 / G3) TaxID=412133 RepID=A2ESV6_TRIV3|nr:NO mechanoreceptor potential C, isoform D-related family [Trichomonas vaginalis G3]EAY04282.1 hypothetical protein TVAG_390520 [Trichomonas vaginalis G3]KAI5549375.1 NO mechanoreceptor potential C, isoform D-related family [Trichomonas vaginalis G3]|eukprot:XP_001316505.1 hypothetical protein [Trichomonas vaginalis G3]
MEINESSIIDNAIPTIIPKGVSDFPETTKDVYNLIRKQGNYEKIISAKFDPNSKFKGQTCLEIAITSKVLDSVKALLEKGANPNTIVEDRYTMIMLAMKTKNQSIIQELLNHGADPSYVNPKSEKAIDFGNSASRQALVGYDKSIKPQNDFMKSIQNNENENFLFWLTDGKDINKHELISGISAFHYACMSGNLLMVSTLKKLGVDWQYRDKKGFNGLYYAIKNNHLNIVKYWSKVFNINELNSEKTALMIAVKFDHPEIVEFLMGVSDISILRKEETAIFRAIRKNKSECVKMMLKAKPDLNKHRGGKDNKSLPSEYAAKYNSIETLSVLCSENNVETTPIFIVAENGSIKGVETLLQKGNNDVDTINPNNGDTLLLSAIRSGNIELVNFLLEKGARVFYTNFEGDSSFTLSINLKKYNILEILLKSVHDDLGREFVWKVFKYAAEKNDEKSASLILPFVKERISKENITMNASLNSNILKVILGYNDKDKMKKGKDIFDAIQRNDLNAVKFYLYKKVNIDIKSKENNSLLMHAALYNAKEVFEFLLNIGINKEYQKDDGKDCLVICIQNNRTEFVKLLAEKGVDLKMPRLESSDPITIACESGSLDVLKYLISKEIKPNEVSKESEIPLAAAVISGHLDIVKYLIEEIKLSPDTMNKDKIPIISLSVLHKQKEVFKYLSTISAIKMTDSKGNTLLHYAAMANDVETCEFCLANGIEVDQTNSDEAITPYLCAVKKSNKEAMNYLLSKGANPKFVTEYNTNALFYAIESGDLELVTELSNNGFDVNGKNSAGMTPYLVACKFGHEKIVKFLEKKGAKEEERDNNNCNALYYAAIGGNKNLFSHLVHWKTKLDETFDNGVNYLHLACIYGNTEIVKYLYKKGLSPFDLTQTKISSFHYAASKNNLECFELLHTSSIKNSKDPYTCEGPNGHFPLETALRTGTKVAQYILDIKDYPATFDAYINYLLNRSCKEGNLRMVRIILNHKNSINSVFNGETPIIAAGLAKNFHIVKYLKEANAEIESTQYESLMFRTIKNNDIESLKVLISLGFDCNEKMVNGLTPLHLSLTLKLKQIYEYLMTLPVDILTYRNDKLTTLEMSVETGDAKVVEKIINKGALINVQSDDNTPLIYSIRMDQKDAFEMLLTKGAKIFLHDHKNGNYPIHIAATAKNDYYLKKLIELNVEVDIKNYNNETPLFFAVNSNNIENYRTLVSHGANNKVLNKDGRNLLFNAIFSNSFEMADILIADGLDVNHKDINGKTCFDYIIMGDNCSCLKYLLEKKLITSNMEFGEGENLLTFSIDMKALNCVNMLIDDGYEVTAANKNKQTALHKCAIYSSLNEILSLAQKLVQKGANINAVDKDNSTPLTLTNWYMQKDRRLAHFLKSVGGIDPIFEQYKQKTYKDLEVMKNNNDSAENEKKIAERTRNDHLDKIKSLENDSQKAIENYNELKKSFESEIGKCKTNEEKSKVVKKYEKKKENATKEKTTTEQKLSEEKKKSKDFDESYNAAFNKWNSVHNKYTLASNAFTDMCKTYDSL